MREARAKDPVALREGIELTVVTQLYTAERTTHRMVSRARHLAVDECPSAIFIRILMQLAHAFQ